MELKCYSGYNVKQDFKSFNRTFMELKSKLNRFVHLDKLF